MSIPNDNKHVLALTGETDVAFNTNMYILNLIIYKKGSKRHGVETNCFHEKFTMYAMWILLSMFNISAFSSTAILKKQKTYAAYSSPKKLKISNFLGIHAKVQNQCALLVV